ncbi:MAG: YajG family lipoprotein [Sulfurimonas sp.]|nr:YajG family lipoprotein [Sulfurimonas sp.]
MKNFIYILIAALFMAGCSYKNEAINLHAYKGEYSGEIAPKNKAVYLRSVTDARANKHVIGSIYKGGEKYQNFNSNVDFATKYKEGLGYALDIAGFNKVSNPNDATLIMDVVIKDIAVVYNDKNFDKNLKGSIEIEVKIDRGHTVTTQSFQQKASKWIAPSYESKDIEPFLYSLFADSINDIASRLTRY